MAAAIRSLTQPYHPQISLTSIGNSLQNYKTLHFSRRFYNGLYVRNKKLPSASGGYNPEDDVNKFIAVPQNEPNATDQMTPLAARLFGTWTFMVSIVRLYAAYNLHIGPMYDLAVWTYIVALIHFGSEVLVFKGMRFGGPQTLPLIVATTALIWMPSVRSYYVQA